MDTDTLKKRFREIGADIRVRPIEHRRRRTDRDSRRFIIDVTGSKRGERFDLQVADDDVEFLVQDARPAERHLVLLVAGERTASGKPAWDRYLCGHDERHWFVAQVPVNVTSIDQAREALKPQAVRDAQVQRGVKRSDRRRRRTKAFIRQGEWFFVPVNDLDIGESVILRDEPISRGRGKPHVVEELWRRGGTRVHVCNQYPRGLTDSEFRALLRREPQKKNLPWMMMMREPEAFGRGKVRHPDHKTIELRGWHRILLSEEVRSANVAFLD